MARVLIYERAVNAVITDAKFYENSQFNTFGILTTIKAELPDINDDEENLENMSLLDTANVNDANISIEEESTNNSLKNKKDLIVTDESHLILSKKKRKMSPKNLVAKNKRLKRHRNSMDDTSCHRKLRSKEKPSENTCDSFQDQAMNERKNVICEVCFLTFTTVSNLKLHTLRYAKYSPYSCNKCPVRFIKQENLKRHIRNYHSGRKRRRYTLDSFLKYNCNFCDHRCRTKETLQAHLFHFHQPYVRGDTSLNADESIAKSINTANTPTKKLRQTTLTEFLQVPDKELKLEPISPTKTDDSSTRDVSTPCESSRQPKGVSSGSVVRNTPKPFVTIYAKPDIIKALLESSVDKVKEEITYDATSHCHTQYSLRSTRSDSSSTVGERSPRIAKAPRSSDTVTATPSRRRHTEASRQFSANQEASLRAKFQCKPCTVTLLRCDVRSNANPVPKSTPSVIIPGPVPLSPLQSTENSGGSNLHETEGQNVMSNISADKAESKRNELATEELARKRINLAVTEIATEAMKNVDHGKSESVAREEGSNKCKGILSEVKRESDNRLTNEIESESGIETNNEEDNSAMKQVETEASNTALPDAASEDRYLDLQETTVESRTVAVEEVENKKANVTLSDVKGEAKHVSEVKQTKNYVLSKEVKILLEKLQPTFNIAIVKTEPEDAPSLSQFLGKSYACKVCDKVHYSKESRRQHMKLFHVAYMSSICRARYTLKRRLLHHYLRQHVLFRKRECCICGQAFPSRAELKRHLSVHCIKFIRSPGDTIPVDVEVRCNAFKKSHKCHACGRSFWLYSCLKEHKSVCRQWKQRMDHDRNRRQTFARKDAILRIRIRGRTDCGNVTTEPAIVEPPSQLMNEDASVPHQTIAVTSNGLTSDQNQAQAPLAHAVSSTIVVPAASSSSSEDSRKLAINVQDSDSNDIDNSVRFNASKIRYPCNVCGIKFQTFKNLCMHKRTFSMPKKERCEMCDTQFPSIRLLRSHISMAHVPEVRDTYKLHCRYCNQGFSTKGSVRMHELHFHNPQNYVFPTQVLAPDQGRGQKTICSVCHVIFESYDRYLEHNMYYYTGTSYPCTFCGQSFNGMYMLHHHTKKTHYPEEARNAYSFTCDICNEGFKRETHYHAHKVHVHKMESHALPKITEDMEEQSETEEAAPDETVANISHSCDVCNMTFTNAAALALHEANYSDKPSYGCDKCQRKYHTLEAVSNHQKFDHSLSQPVAKQNVLKNSENVNRVLPLVSNNNSVDITVTNQDTPKSTNDRFVCSICDSRFTTEIGLQNHLREFANMGNYACSVCNRKFVEQYYLEKHMLQHSSLSISAPFRCNICKEAFSVASAIDIHTLHIHWKDTSGNKSSASNKFVSSIERDASNPTNNSNIKGNSSVSVISDVTVIPNLHVNLSPHINANFNGNPNVGNVRPNNASINSISDQRKPPEAVKSTVGQIKVAAASVQSIKKVPDCSNKNRTPSSSSGAGKVKGQDKAKAPDGPQNQPVRCDVCYLSFTCIVDLTKHKMLYVNKGDFVCEVCGRRFPWRSVFQAHHRKHLQSEENNSTLKFDCPYCDEKFSTSNFAQSHVIHLHETLECQSSRSSLNELESRMQPQELFFEEQIKSNEPAATAPPEDVQYLGTENPVDLSKDPLTINYEDSGVQVIDISGSTYLPRTESSSLTKDNSCMLASRTAQNANPETSLNEITKPGQSYTCPICLTVFPGLNYFKMHFISFHPKSGKQRSKTTVPDHVSKEDGYRCVICDVPVENEAQLKQHLIRVHMPRHLKKPVAIARKNPMQSTPATVSNSVLTDPDAPQVVWEQINSQNAATDADVVILPSPDIRTAPSASTTVSSKPLKQDRTQAIASQPPNSNLGKLKVKPFAKIIENLSRSNMSKASVRIEPIVRQQPLPHLKQTKPILQSHMAGSEQRLLTDSTLNRFSS